MILIVTSSYRCRDVVYTPGQVLEVSETEATSLLADAPGCFQVEVSTPDALPEPEPPPDKMVRVAPRRKAG
jgi:hypothetical protein